jgi:DeoR family glycerol-3-phosphate regulon repressor
MKFARSAPVRIGHISQIDHLVTDEAPPAAVAALLREHDIGIDVVGTTD